jgi:mannosyltransferase OCH1-like enzyme
MKIDILRYCILEQFGGMYVDIDYKCFNNFDNYLIKNNKYEIYLNEEAPNVIANFFTKTISNSLIISIKPHLSFWKYVICECFDRIKTYYPSFHINYVLKTTGPILINDVLHKVKNIDNKVYDKINLLPYQQFNYCDYCNRCYPSKTKRLYAKHDYASSWHSNLWLKIKMLTSCTPLKDIIFFVLIISLCLIFKKF